MASIQVLYRRYYYEPTCVYLPKVSILKEIAQDGNVSLIGYIQMPTSIDTHILITIQCSL